MTGGLKSSVGKDINLNDTLERDPNVKLAEVKPADKTSAAAKEERLKMIKIRIENFMQKESLPLPFFYELIDTVKDKVVTRDEFSERMKKIDKIKLNQLEADSFFDLLDIDNSGGITYKELVMAFKDTSI